MKYYEIFLSQGPQEDCLRTMMYVKAVNEEHASYLAKFHSRIDFDTIKIFEIPEDYYKEKLGTQK